MNAAFLDSPPNELSDFATMSSNSTHAHTTAGSPVLSDKCCCVEKMVECLDDLEKRTNTTTIVQITFAMDQQRRAWKQCQAMSSCQACRPKRSTIILFTMSYECIAESIHRAFTEYLVQLQQITDNTLPEVTVGEYQLGSQDELLAVLQALVDIRLKEMASDVGRMQSQQNDGIMELHKVRLRVVVEKVQEIATRLRYLSRPGSG
nr:hypothetical protein CFP56_72366 [Quercus suber]